MQRSLESPVIYDWWLYKLHKPGWNIFLLFPVREYRKTVKYEGHLYRLTTPKIISVTYAGSDLFFRMNTQNFFRNLDHWFRGLCLDFNNLVLKYLNSSREVLCVSVCTTDSFLRFRRYQWMDSKQIDFELYFSNWHLHYHLT